MKKLMVSIIAIALGAAAFAKTDDEILSEFVSLENNWVVQTAWAKANIEDLKTSWAAFKTTPFALLPSDGRYITAFNALDSANKKAVENKKSMYSYLYAQIGESFDATDVLKLSINAPRFCRNNPDKFAAIKKAGWIIDGVEISPSLRIHIGIVIEDYDVVYDNREAFSRFNKDSLDALVPQIRRALLSMSDASKAKEICNAFENAMLVRDCANTDKIQSVGKALTSRIVDAKISK